MWPGPSACSFPTRGPLCILLRSGSLSDVLSMEIIATSFHLASRRQVTLIEEDFQIAWHDVCAPTEEILFLTGQLLVSVVIVGHDAVVPSKHCSSDLLYLDVAACMQLLCCRRPLLRKGSPTPISTNFFPNGGQD